MQSVEFYTINASNPRIFLFATLRKLVSDKEIDLEDLLHQNHRLARASMGRDANGSEPYGVTVIKLLEKVGAIANSNSLAQQRVASWQTFLQKTAISSFVQMYLRHFFLQAHTGVITGDQQQAFSQTLQKIFDATHVEQILFLVQGVIQQEERQGREVFASILQAQFGIAPEMIKGIDTNYFDNAEIQEIGEHLQTLLTQSLLENSLREELQFRETESIARNDGSVASITKQSPLPKGWRDALPQVLAEAFLSGSLNKLDVLWTELNTYHRQDLLQAQKRYLHLAQLRDRLLQSESHEKILDLISTFSPSLKLLLLEIRTHQARLVQLWHLKMSHDQLFSSLLRNSYHLLFSAQLEQKTAAQQLQQILQSMPFWPQQLSTQQRHLRAFYYDLIDEPESLLSNCLRTLYQKERIGLMAAQHSQPIDLELNAATYAEGADAWRSDSSPALLSDDMLSDACLDEMSVNGNSFYDQLDCLDAALSSSNEQAALANLIEGLSTSVLAQSSNETRAKIWQQTAESLYEGRHQVSAERPNLEQAQWLLGTQVLAHSLHAHHADVLLPRESHKTNRNTEPTDNKSETSIERLIVLLHSAAPLQHTESVWMRLQIMNLITRPSPDILTLAPSLNSNTVLRKMTTILDSVDLEHLYRRLHPQLHTQLHVLCRAIEKTKQLSLHDADNFLEASSWFAIYQASKKSTGENIRSFTLALLSAIQRQHQASESDQAGQLLDPNRGLQDLVAYARDQKREAERARLANEEAKKKTLDTLKKKARLLGEEEEIPYGESNVSNAGMVIIAPYIQRLFNLLELTRDGAFITEEAAERAVHLLQYVVTAEQSTPEYQLALNKLLCGIHGGVPIVAGINISEHEKTVIEQMLMGVISHWSALGKTSISGLRQTFLAREGQLSFVDENWQLRIPSSSFDMLLDRLPWSFAMIKFPWMRAPLHVTWR